MKIALDSARSVDENGFMHVASSHITKAVVNPYYGSEIPGWRESGLDPQKVYYGFRDPEELQKSLRTWAGLPLHFQHHEDSAEDPQKDSRVGTVGTEVVWADPYVDAPLTIWDRTAITAIEDGTCRELSCAYRYDPDWTAGTWEGTRYDFIMRHIRGNHVALVEEGRAGPDVVVADEKLQQSGGNHMADEMDLAQAILDLHKAGHEDEEKVNALKGALDDITEGVAPEKVDALKAALAGLAAVEEVTDEEPEAPAPEAPASEAQDEDSDIKAAISALGLDPENEAVVNAFKAGIEHAGKPAADEEQAPAPEAKDEESPAPAPSQAMDAAKVKAETVKHMQALFNAVEQVKPLTGPLQAMAFDSAEAVYAHALKAKGMDPGKYDRKAWRGMVEVLLRERPSGFRMAQDVKPAEFTGSFKYLKTMTISN